MPLVTITHKGFSEEEFSSLARWLNHILPVLVAQYLGVPGTEAALTPEEVEIEFRLVGPYDSTRYNLAVKIDANDYPWRRDLVKSAEQAIWNDIMLSRLPVLRGKSVFVWARLAYGGFVDSVGEDTQFQICPDCAGIMRRPGYEWMCEDCGRMISPPLFNS